MYVAYILDVFSTPIYAVEEVEKTFTSLSVSVLGVAKLS